MLVVGAIRALHESAKVRVTSVDNGEAHFAKGGGEIDMTAISAGSVAQ